MKAFSSIHKRVLEAKKAAAKKKTTSKKKLKTLADAYKLVYGKKK
jgi:hypothetical protein